MKCASRSPRFASAAVVAAAASSMLAASAHATTYTATFASWLTNSGTGTASANATGSLGSTSFTVSNTGAGTEAELQFGNYNLSNASNYVATGSASQQSLEFNQGNTAPTTTTITFASAVSDLALYTIFWRELVTGATYSLVAKDASNNDVAYSFLSGTQTPTVTNNSFSPSGWLSGIIQFSGAVKSITFTTTAMPVQPGISVLNLATLQASAVPGSGLAAIGTLGLACVARRRRR